MEGNKSDSETAEEFPRMLEFERQMFLDVIDSDGLLIVAKGLNESIIVQNILKSYNDPSNLVLVINGADFEDKYYIKKLNIPQLPNTATEREKLYFNGGVHVVSTRILVVDLLKKRIPVHLISGIIVLRAHTILESCQEAFALRLYRQGNKTGFIKAFSHSPQSFTFGYSHVERVMRSLFLTELFLWPRFHSLVSQYLKNYPPTVVELHVPLSHNATLIQTCLLDLMNHTTKELKKINQTTDIQEITVENCIAKNFHKLLQQQLDCIWHQLSTRTKELVQDLKIMRNLMIHLIHHDAVSFYGLLGQYKTPEYAKINSGWLLLDSTEQLFKYAKNRVFNSKQEFTPEMNSKWKCLSDILTIEIPANEKKMKSPRKNIKILILCYDSKTCSQLNEFLTLGPDRYFTLTALRNGIRISGATVQDPKDNNCENNETNTESSQSATSESLEKTDYVLTMTQVLDNISQEKNESANESIFEPFTQMENMDLTQLDSQPPMVYIQTFKNFNGGVCLENALESLRPNYMVMYHSDVAATRQVELYEARRKDKENPLVIFFLIHARTTEEQSYLTSLRREKESFELLIETKSTMVIPSYQDGKTDIVQAESAASVEVNTRKAGGQEDENATAERQRIIVDMREFRSDLPALLHKKGIDIDPVTIAIGDYILTPDICVERKSLSDLIGSLNSGRLYTQCTQMCRHYSRPMLLIEFDQNKPFQLQGHYMLSTDTSGSDIRQKLQLLTMHFPKLKLIWSPNAYATTELFHELKQGRAQPSTEKAMTLGEDDGLGEDRYNPHVYDFMLKLPGVNSKNIARLMNKGISLDNIVKLTKQELNEIIGNMGDVDMLWNILHNAHKPESSEPKQVQKNRFGKPMRGKRKY